jgi:hypothetical protein
VHGRATTDPGTLRRAEWIKYVGLFFNKEAEANARFNAIEKSYNTASAAALKAAGAPPLRLLNPCPMKHALRPQTPHHAHLSTHQVISRLARRVPTGQHHVIGAVLVPGPSFQTRPPSSSCSFIQDVTFLQQAALIHLLPAEVSLTAV